MLAKRIIPCLDVRNGKTVKGVNFIDIKEVGDPVELGKLYAKQGADELVYLDITATLEGRKSFVDLIKKIAKTLNIPFTVGGGISTIDDAKRLLDAGADKVSINSAAVKNPKLIDDISNKFGSQFVVLAIDARLSKDRWSVTINGGRIETDKELFDWVKEGENRGAGEILFTSMNHDGTKNGFALCEIRQMHEMLSIPIIASGGAGNAQHFVDAFSVGKADAALAASIFHYGEISIPQLKSYLAKKNVIIR
ncbi:MAG: imidazole glycerol phosphate synthase subunit HisF [Bacteroidales bacterium]